MPLKPASPYACPFCKAAIPIADVNVSTDVALCRACGKTSSFSAVAGVGELAAVDLAQPPRHVKVGLTPDGRSWIIYRRVSPVLLFLVPFTLFWSGLSMVGIYGTQIHRRHFELAQSLFGLPFLLGTCGLLSAIAFMALGRWEITVGNGEGTVFVGVGAIGRRRKFRYTRTSMAGIVDSDRTSKSGRQRAVGITTDGEVFKFGTGIPDDSLRFIAASLQQAIARV
jgi:hypothetical protein